MQAARIGVTPGRPFRSVLGYCRPHWRQYAAGAVLSLVFILTGLCTPLVVCGLVHRFEVPPTDPGYMTTERLLLYFGALVAISASSGIVRYYQRLLTIRASRDVEYDIRNDLFAHIQGLSQDFFRRTKTGDIMAKATNDLNYVRMLIGPGIMGAVDILRVPFALCLLFYFNAQLALVTLVPLPFVSLLVYVLATYMHRQSKAVHEQFSTVTSRAQENLAGARVVKAYGVADREQADFGKESRTYVRENMKLAAITNLMWPLIGMVLGLAMLLPLWRGGVMVIRGETTVSVLIGFTTALQMMLWPLVRFGWLLTVYQRGAVSMNRIAEIFAEQASIKDGADTRHDLPPIQGEVVFENVSLAYDGRVVLDNISFKIEEGTTVAIVGPTGAGKTSIVSLLTRESDPASGRVLVDGVDARRIPVAALRAAVGYVPQDTFLFSESIRFNLLIGSPDASEAQLEAASEAAQFKAATSAFEHGYDTLLGERGVNLSGGQKQRLALARAIVRDPRILVLDDALSSVDTHTEELILQNLKMIMATRTSVIISHRVSTIRHADEILVIDDGRIVERGSHEELLERGGIYTRMFERQQLEDELELE